jgi:hypothetical protein
MLYVKRKLPWSPSCCTVGFDDYARLLCAAVHDFDTDLQAYLSASTSYTSISGLDLWINDRQCAKFSQLAQLAQDLLAAPATEAYVERVFSVCGDLTSGKRNRLTKNLHM